MKKLLQKFGVSCKQDVYRLFRQFFKFSIVGLSNTAVSLGVYYFFVWIRNDTFMAMTGHTLGWFLGVANSFLWNKLFVFKESEEIWWKALIKTYLGYGTSFLVSLALIYIQVKQLGISTYIAPLTAFAVTIPMNFLVSKFWSFQKNIETGKNTKMENACSQISQSSKNKEEENECGY